MKGLIAGIAGLLVFAAAATPDAARRAACTAQAEALVDRLDGAERLSQLMMDSPAVPRLGVPAYHWWNEALHGDARAGAATVFPQAIGLAATFDTDLLRRVGDLVSTEARAKYNLFSAKGDRGIYAGLTFWSPNVNMFRDPRWGRGQETYGEDPFLSGAIGAAYVKGLQGDDPKYLKVAACAKHFAVHSGPEADRHGFDAKVMPRDLAEYYLPAFRTLVKDAEVEAFMGAYSAINGKPCCANAWLLTDLLRGEWGFRGHVVSDVGAVNDICAGHRFATNDVAACLAAMKAGLDLCSEETYGCLAPALADGRVSSDDLRAPLVRLYTTRALLGQFDPLGSTPWDKLGADDICSDAGRALALEAAEKSLVLVKNDGALPIDLSTVGSVGVGGPRAACEIALHGNYCGYPLNPVSVLTGVLRECGTSVRVSFGSEITDCDVLIACLGITADDEGEEGCSLNNAGGDRVAYGLPQEQLDRLAWYRRKTKKLVAVVFGGSPVDLQPIAAIADAVIVAWYPGEQGGTAVARTVFGRSNPSGRLPVSYPKSYDDLPDFRDYALAGRTYRYATKAPAYPFGFGLSYTTFAYSDAKLERVAEGVRATVDVTNTGRYAGDEVVQIYLRTPGDRRRSRLAGFTRVTLAPGERKTATVTIPKSEFAVYGEAGQPDFPNVATEVSFGAPGSADEKRPVLTVKP